MNPRNPHRSRAQNKFSDSNKLAKFKLSSMVMENESRAQTKATTIF